LRALERLRDALLKAGYNFNGLEPKDITDEHVNVFHEYLLNELNLGTRSYAKHIGINKTFFFWLKRVKDLQINNPFCHVELHTVKKDITLITKTEFEKLLCVITRENSFDKKTKRYMYRDWLVLAYRLALETGLRREELLTLSWANIVPIDGHKMVCKVDNLKVNRIMTGRSDSGRIKYIPVTKGLLALLNELGYEEKKNSAAYIIERPAQQELGQAMDLLSCCFAHYIKLVTDRPLEFGVLRKTFITRLTMAAGPNAKLFTGHTDNSVLQNYYLSTAFMAANLEDFTVL
jgi:integrase